MAKGRQSVNKQSVRRSKAVRFLREHPPLWAESERAIVRALKSAGIVARSTYYMDCNVQALLREAQAEPKPKRQVRPRCPTCGHVLPRTGDTEHRV